MQFTCDRNELLEAVMTVSKAMAQRTSIPLIEGILLKGENGLLELFCTDLKLSIKSTIRADFDGMFSCVMPGKLFTEVVRRLPEDDVHITLEEGNEGSYKVTILCRDSRTTLTALDAEQFPRVEEAIDENAVEIEERVLKAMIRQTAFAVAQDNTRPIFTGELLEIEGDSINVVALDGFKFAMRTAKLSKETPARRCVVPGRVMLEVMRILGDSSDIVRLHFSGKNFMLQKDSTRVITRLLEGDFIRYSQIIPKDSTTMVRVAVDDLRAAISRAELIAADDRVNLVKFAIGDDEIVVTSNSESGNVREKVNCMTQGAHLDTAFNIKYIGDALRALECDEVVLHLTSSISACVLKPAGEEQFLYLVLPVQI